MSEFYVYEEDDVVESFLNKETSENLIKNKKETLDHKPQLECHLKHQATKNVQIVQNQTETLNLVTEQQNM